MNNNIITFSARDLNTIPFNLKPLPMHTAHTIIKHDTHSPARISDKPLILTFSFYSWLRICRLGFLAQPLYFEPPLLLPNTWKHFLNCKWFNCISLSFQLVDNLQILGDKDFDQHHPQFELIIKLIWWFLCFLWWKKKHLINNIHSNN